MEHTMAGQYSLLAVCLSVCVCMYLCQVTQRVPGCPIYLFCFHNELEVHGRARREAARRRKSEWKVNLDIRNSSRSNGSWRMTT